MWSVRADIWGGQKSLFKTFQKKSDSIDWRWTKKVTKDENNFDWGIGKFRDLVQNSLDKVPLNYFQKIHDEVIRFEQVYAVSDNVQNQCFRVTFSANIF